MNINPCSRFASVLGIALGVAASLHAAAPDLDLTNYFRAETARIAAPHATPPSSLAAWNDQRERFRSELQDMLGLRPYPARTDLKPVVTGLLDGPGIVVEKLHFQSLPGLYVTANLYRPKSQDRPLPAVLYVCGHSRVVTNGISCGNKAGYQHHGIWFARHGYVCLLVDTLQLGEIEGFHHGTHRLGQWWWNSRGYTPAGVEAWNGIRAVDYLQSRPEVDPHRIGMTGRSGGGSYSWTTAALDDRVRVTAPVAGITDLHDHVVQGVVEGHCDCMYFVNTHRWDFARNAQLLAPRPLLIVNTDADGIFPLGGVQRIHAATRDVYRLHGIPAALGLAIGPGDHKDTQDLQVPVFRWFNQHLRSEDPLITHPAVKLFQPLELRVFSQLPTDQRNTTAAEWFGPQTYPNNPPSTPIDNVTQAVARLSERTFAGWPDPAPVPLIEESDRREENGFEVIALSFPSQEHVPLVLRLAIPVTGKPDRVILHVLDDGAWSRHQALVGERGITGVTDGLPAGTAVAWFTPRGIGPGKWSGDDRRAIQIRRRFMLLGQTVDGMRVWDIVSAIRALGQGRFGELPVELHGHGTLATQSLLASLYARSIDRLRVPELPATFMDGPDYLNILQFLDIPQALALARKKGIEIHVR